MSGKISWELDLKGGETVAQKFRDLNKEVATLQGNLKKGISIGDLLKATGGNFSKATLAANPQLMEQLGKQSGKTFSKGFIDGRFEGMQQLSRRGGSQAMIDMQAAIAMADFKQNNPATKSGGFGGFVPPRIRTLLGAFGGGDEGGGKIASVIGGLVAFRAALWAIQPIIHGLRIAFRELLQSIHEGAKLYQDAAKLGLSPIKTVQLQFSANNLGISTQEAQQMILAGEFPRSNRTRGGLGRNSTSIFRGSMTIAGGQVFGANGRLNMLGEQQKLNNLQTDFNRLMRESLEPSQRLGSDAKVLQRTQELINESALEWKATIADIATALAPVVVAMSELAKYSLFVFNKFTQSGHIIELLSAINRQVAGPANFTQNLPGATNNSLNPNQFQRMGFVMNGGFLSTSDLAKRTAKATERTAALLEKAYGNNPVGNVLAGIMTQAMLP